MAGIRTRAGDSRTSRPPGITSRSARSQRRGAARRFHSSALHGVQRDAMRELARQSRRRAAHDGTGPDRAASRGSSSRRASPSASAACRLSIRLAKYPNHLLFGEMALLHDLLLAPLGAILSSFETETAIRREHLDPLRPRHRKRNRHRSKLPTLPATSRHCSCARPSDFLLSVPYVAVACLTKRGKEIVTAIRQVGVASRASQALTSSSQFPCVLWQTGPRRSLGQ